MAVTVPDPLMNEMRIMAYGTRQKTSDYSPPIPHRNDYIDVLWCMDHLLGLPEKWCPAEVLHISGFPDQDYLACGVILYLPGDTWDEQTHRVEFLSNYKLRRAKGGDADEKNEDDGDNPTLSWRFSSNLQDPDDPTDMEWTPSKERLEKSLSRAQSERATSLPNQENNTSLRSGHAATIVEIQKLKREMTTLSAQMYKLQSKRCVTNEACSSAGCVLSRLVHKIALKAQNNPRPMQSRNKKKCAEGSEQSIIVRTGDGLHVGTMKTRVECTLRQFEHLACIIKANCTSDTVHFQPSFEHIQEPLQCSDEFRILFSTFADLAHHVGISSHSDRMEIARKCGSGPQGDILRILGTYCYDSNDEKSAAIIFPGSSCGSHEVAIPNGDQVSGVQREAAQLYPVLVRKSREWNAVDKRFIHGLRLDNWLLTRLGDSCMEMQAFQLQWRRAPDVSGRSWSRTITDSPTVHGWLEIFLPFVQTQGRHLCVEIGGLASDDVWVKLL